MLPKLKLTAVVICSMLILTACFEKPSPFLKIKEGMSEDEVIKSIGQPEIIAIENESSGDMTVWQYRGPKEPIKKPRSVIGPISKSFGPRRDQRDALDSDKRVDHYVAPLRKIYFKNGVVSKIKTIADIS